jgi:hypothetical protein
MVSTPGVIVLIDDPVLAGDVPDDVEAGLELQAATNALSNTRAIPARIETVDRGIPTTLLPLAARGRPTL